MGLWFVPQVRLLRRSSTVFTDSRGRGCPRQGSVREKADRAICSSYSTGQVNSARSPLHDRTARRPFPGFTRSTLVPADSQRLASLSASAPLLAVVPAHSHAHHDWLARHPRQGHPAPPQGRQLVPSEQHHHFAPAEPRRRRQGVDRFESQVARLVQGFVRDHPQVSCGTCLSVLGSQARPGGTERPRR